jgi:hypothetical protein
VEKIDYPYDTSTVFTAPPSTEDIVDEKIGELLVVNYRYARFALDPRTGLFDMIRFALLYLRCGQGIHKFGQLLERFILEWFGCHTEWVDSQREDAKEYVVWSKLP